MRRTRVRRRPLSGADDALDLKTGLNDFDRDREDGDAEKKVHTSVGPAKHVNRNGERGQWVHQWLDLDCLAVPTPENGLVAHIADEGFTARLYGLCLSALRLLYRRKYDYHSPELQVHKLKEELEKLYLWGEHFEAGELDRALDQSEDLKENVLELLSGIGKLILRELRLSKAPISPHACISNQNEFQELETSIKQAQCMIGVIEQPAERQAINSVDELELDSDSDTIDKSPNDVCEEIGFSTHCLIELAPVLEQNLLRAQRAHAQPANILERKFLLSDPASIYVSLVREKFEHAQDQLVNRLGEANWQRHTSVRQRIEDVHAADQNNEAEVFKGPDMGSSIFRPYSAFHDSGIGTSVPVQTTYAPSHTSFQSSNTEDTQDCLRVPPTPANVTEGKPFQCYLCGHLLSKIKSRVDWKMHVFADLKPYICSFSKCKYELAQFPYRAQWAEHEFTRHRVNQSWSCPECLQSCTSSSDWEYHLQNHHNLIFTGVKLQAAREMAYRVETRIGENEECPLCRVTLGKSRRAFAKHVGRHMEEIALMALPRDNAEESDEESDEESTSTEQDPSDAVLFGAAIASNDETTRCVCGEEDYPGPLISTSKNNTRFLKNDPAEFSIQCEDCHVRQHGGCVGIPDVHTCPDEYHCEQCRPNLHESKTTADGRNHSFYAFTTPVLPIQPKRRNSVLSSDFMKTDDGIDSKHMDRHARPYLCREPGCKDIEGFQYPGGLLRHQGEVHPPHRGAEPPRFCPYNDCKRSTGLGFLTKNILDEHLRCLHPAYVYEHMSKQNGNGLECEDKSSDHEPRYCYCGEPSYGEMVGCDNTDCPREWFHLLCAGLTKVPGQNVKWYCRECVPFPSLPSPINEIGAPYSPQVLPQEESHDIKISNEGDQRRKVQGKKPQDDRMWTEFTQNLFSKEAIMQAGYEYEEDEEFVYVKEHLKYEDVLRLVELTEDIERDHRERVHKTQAEPLISAPVVKRIRIELRKEPNEDANANTSRVPRAR